jgi:hypothetical protein
MLGVKPEDARENKAEAPESYRDIGEQRLAAAAERVRGLGGKVGGFMGRAWDKIKSFGSKTKEAGKSALVYTLAAPEMVRDAGVAAKEGVVEGATYVGEKAQEGAAYVGEKAQQGAEYVAEKGKAAYEGAKDIGATAASMAFEGAVTAYDKTAEGVVYVSEKGKAAYEGAVNFGKEKYAGLQRRAEDARGIFQAAVNEARRRRQERLAREQGNREYEEALQILRSAQERVQAFENRFSGGRSERAAA